MYDTYMENHTATVLLRDRCLALADELADFGIDRVDDRDLALALEGLTEANLYATAEAIAYLGDWFN